MVNRDRADPLCSAVAAKFELNLPPYEGVDQVVELPRVE